MRMWNISYNVWWEYDDRTKTVYIRGHGDMPEFSLDDDEKDADIPWLDLDFERAVVDYGITSIGTHAFLNCKRLRYAYLSDTVVDINDFAFEGCTGLVSVRLPERLILLGNSAFFGCRSLRDIRLPDRLINISDYAFHGCSSLKVLEIPEGVEMIGSRSFYDCKSLTLVIDRNRRMDIEDDAFDEDVRLVGRKAERRDFTDTEE